MPCRLPVAAVALAAALALPAAADPVLDGLDAAREAYSAGDIAAAMEELGFVQAALQDLHTKSIAEFLPPAPAGWTREVTTEIGGIMAMTGGGAGAVGTYSDGSQEFSISIMADSPLIAAMGAMLSSPLVAQAAGGKLERIGDVKVLHMDGNLTALLDNRILVTAEGAPTEVMLPLLEQMDFAGLEAFSL